MRNTLLLLIAVLVPATPVSGQSLLDSLRVPTVDARAMAVAAGFRATSPPPGPVRAVAEFERSEAVLVSYPKGFGGPGFFVPLDLIAALSEQTRVISLVFGAQEEDEMAAAYADAGVVMANAEFVHFPADAPWIRDNGPMYVADGSGQIGLVDFVYDILPFEHDNAAPAALGAYLDVPVYTMDLSHAGGNYMTTGTGLAASTNLVLETNGGDDSLVRQQMEAYLGIEEYLLFEDPQATYIDHVDTWAKFLDVDKVMITQAEPGHPDYDALEAIAAAFESMASPWGTPFQVFRVFAPDRQPYANALILNDHVYVPVEEEGAELDEAALDAYRAAMPGYTVLGFEGNWDSTAALHCLLKEVADTGLLSVRHRPYTGNVPHTATLDFDAEIVAYSGQPLLYDELHLVYRTGTAPYDTLALEPVGGDTFRATLPAPPSGTEVSYYLSASDASGRTEHFPLVGPEGPRTFRLAPATDAEGAAPPTAFDLEAAPNPASGPVAVRYALSAGATVTLDVFDVLGRRVARLHDGPVQPGEHRATWEPDDAAPGVYFVRLVSSDGAQATRRVTVVR